MGAQGIQGAQDGIWLTKDGKFIPVSQMERSHIEYSIAKIKRDFPWRSDFLPRLELELRIRDVLGRTD